MIGDHDDLDLALINDVLSIKLLSMLSSAMSLTMTAALKSSSECFDSRICFRSVVFPAPRNPHNKVTGTLSGNSDDGYIFSIDEIY